MKYGIIFTGGTIGCRETADGYFSLKNRPGEQIRRLAEERGLFHGITLCPSEPLHLFSEQMTGKTLALLANHVRTRILTEDCAGWILLHGSDTLAYTAAILGELLGTHLPPLILVASNEPLSNPNADGWTHLSYAIRFLQEQNTTGVFVCHCDISGMPVIHEATRLLQQLPGSKTLYSFCDAVYGRYDADGNFHQETRFPEREPLIPFSMPFSLLHPAPLLQLPATVGSPFPEIPNSIQAIFYQCYHSGTICTDTVFQKWANHVTERNISIYLTGCRSDTMDYETVKQWESLPVYPLYDLAPIDAYCRYWMAISNQIPVAF